jgi:hypothetical protein
MLSGVKKLFGKVRSRGFANFRRSRKSGAVVGEAPSKFLFRDRWPRHVNAFGLEPGGNFVVLRQAEISAIDLLRAPPARGGGDPPSPGKYLSFGSGRGIAWLENGRTW